MVQLRRAFTLLELLVVIVILGMVSGLAIPPVLFALQDRYCASGADLLRGAIAAAQSDAIVANQPRGIRLIPDPAAPGHFTAVVPLRPASDYEEGLVVASDPAAVPFTTPYPCLMVEQCLVDAAGRLAGPTYWWWNIRIGEKVRFSASGASYTVVGPNVEGTPDGYVNVGPPGTPSPLRRPDANGDPAPVEFLWLVNGRDDDGDGLADDGHDGVTTDYEPERWVGPVPSTPTPCIIARRPIRDAESRPVPMPAGVYVDHGRSNLPPIGPAGTIDIMFLPGGEVVQSAGMYSVPSAIGLRPPGYDFRVSQSLAGHDRTVSISGRGVVSSEEVPSE